MRAGSPAAGDVLAAKDSALPSLVVVTVDDRVRDAFARMHDLGVSQLVVGSEGRGLSRLVGATCDLRVSIPMTAAVASLNASVAAAVALAEIARRRGLGAL